MINVTPAAASKISELLAEENKPEAGLRVFVQGGGCSGFQYGLMIDEGEGDATTDAVIESNGVKLLVDPISARYLQRRRSRFRRQHHRRRLHDQEPERQVDLRLRVVVQRLGPGLRSASRVPGRTVDRGRPGAELAVDHGRPPRPTSTACGPPAASAPSKRDLIVNVFLRQEGHLSADDLVDLIRREDQRISRATVYRTLQWMVEAGIARKVDFGEGRFRFEHSYRHPRHFHLICKSCNRSFEFLSSDIEALVEEVAAARGFTPRQSVLQIHGTCEACRTGRPARGRGRADELLFARDALRIAIATERSGLEFYSRAARITRDARGRARVREARRGGEGAPRHARGAATASCCSRTRSSSRGRRSCSSRAPPTACSPRAPSSCRRASTIARR